MVPRHQRVRRPLHPGLRVPARRAAVCSAATRRAASGSGGARPRVRSSCPPSPRCRSPRSEVAPDRPSQTRCNAPASQPNGGPPVAPSPPAAVNAMLPLQVWAGPLSEGRLAAVLLHMASRYPTIHATWDELGLPAGVTALICDDINGKDIDMPSGPVFAPVPTHDAAAFVLTPQSCLGRRSSTGGWRTQAVSDDICELRTTLSIMTQFCPRGSRRGCPSSAKIACGYQS